MPLALFDLDNTLLDGDSDYLWGQFLIEQQIIDGELYERRNQEFYDQYKAGTLDIFEFLDFQLAPLAQHPRTQLDQWHDQYMTEKIMPIILPKARALVNQRRDEGLLPVIITATNSFITGPIAREFGVEHLLATEPEMIDGNYTGKVTGIPCFQDGKVKRLQTWLEETGHDLDNSWFYSDSHNDLPLLLKVSNPVAVNPDDTLHEHAKNCGWPVLDLR